MISLETARRWTAVVLIGWQLYFCLWVGTAFQSSWFIVAGLAVALLLPANRRMRWKVHTLLVTGCAFVFATLAFNKLLTQGGDILVLFRAFSEFLLVVQVLELLRQERPESENYLPGLSTLCLVLATLSVESRLRPPDLTFPILIFFGLMLVHMRADVFVQLLSELPKHRSRAIALAAMFVITIMTGSLFQQELQRDIPPLRIALGVLRDEVDADRIIVGSTARFVEDVGLDSIAQVQLSNPDETVYNVEAELPPGYMRTRSFSFFNGSRWRDPRGGMISRGSLPPEPQEAKGSLASRFDFPDRFQAFALSEPTDSLRQLKVEIPRGRGRQVPLTTNTAILLGETRSARPLRLDFHLNLLPGSLDNSSYQLLVTSELTQSNKLTRADSEYLEKNLQIPEVDRELLVNLARTIVDAPNRAILEQVNVLPVQGDSQSRTEFSVVASAVAAHFHANFTYSLMAKPTKDLNGRSPMEAFLTERREAHCEYFATAAVLLLRSLGIPSRLSTGYLVYEMNDENDYYQATNANAHAWAEYYDAELGRWMLLEATPSIPEYVSLFILEESVGNENLAGNENVTFFQRFWSLVSSLFAELRFRVVSLFTNRYSWILPLMGVGLFLLFRKFRRILQGGSQELRSPEIKRADELAARLGFVRAPSETCRQFATRMKASDEPVGQKLASWYEEFSDQRYRVGSVAALPELPKLSKLSSHSV